MVEIVGHRDTYVDDEPADLSMLAGVHAVAGKDVGRIEAGVAHLERQHAFLKRMKEDWDPWEEEKKLEESWRVQAANDRSIMEKINYLRGEMMDAIFNKYAPLVKRKDSEAKAKSNARAIDDAKDGEAVTKKRSTEARYRNWDVEDISTRGYSDKIGQNHKAVENFESDDDTEVLGAPGGLFHKISTRGRRWSKSQIRMQGAQTATLKVIDNAIRAIVRGTD